MPSRSGIPADERSERDDQDDQGQRNRDEPRLGQIFEEGLPDVLLGADADRPDVEVRVRALHLLDLRDDRIDLVDRLVGLARDLQVDQHRAPVVGDLSGVLGVER